MRSPATDVAFLTRDVVTALPAGELERKLGLGRPLRVKLGLDPTAPDLHLGHTVVLRKLREFQDLGHLVVLIVGDYTARVGDPSGRSVTRPVLSPQEIEANARTYQEQAFAVLDSGRVEVRHNGEWLDMRMEELFALARTTTIAQLLEREDFASRYAVHAPITILELLYPLLQAFDSVAVRADVELGGTDQTFNLLLARDVQRVYGQPQQAVLTLPILAGLDGERKMSKSLANHIGLRDGPDDMYGKVLSLPDEAMGGWYELLLGAPAPTGVSPRDAKHELARRLVERFAGEEAGHAAADAFARVFVQRELPADIADLPFAAADGTVHLPALISEGVGGSRSEARRLLAQGAVRLDGEALGAADVDLAADRLDGRVLQVGRRQFRRLRRAS